MLLAKHCLTDGTNVLPILELFVLLAKRCSTDGMVADKIIELINQKKDEPFFLAAGFFNPHCPYVAPKKYFDLYPIEEITMPDLDEAKADLEDVPPMAVQRDTKKWPYFFDGVTVEEARKCLACLLECLVGCPLECLEHHRYLEESRCP